MRLKEFALNFAISVAMGYFGFMICKAIYESLIP
jgi:hypothetical protein